LDRNTTIALKADDKAYREYVNTHDLSDIAG
jgi:hypothetical protein